MRVEMVSVPHGWEQCGHDASARAESAAAARDAADGFAREALDRQRLEFQRWLAEQTAGHERVLAEERTRHQAEMKFLHSQFASRVRSLELQVEGAQGLYTHAAAERQANHGSPLVGRGVAGRIVWAGI